MFKRNYNTDKKGYRFNDIIKSLVWKKGLTVPGYYPTMLRQDKYGALMLFEDYGRTDSRYGWEIDHIYPVSLGGTDNLSNLQPLNWQNNRIKSNNIIL